MLKKELLNKIKTAAQKYLSCKSHDFEHSERVYRNCLLIAKNEKDVDYEILETAAFLHDIGESKEATCKDGSIDHAKEGAKMAQSILEKIGFPKEKIKTVKHCIESHRFKNNIVPKTIEAKILFDADKIDSLGVIGVARHFMWIGKYNAYLYKEPEDVSLYLKENFTSGENGRIKDKSAHSCQIEYKIKLKNLPKKLYTKTGKAIAKKRLGYFKNFLDDLKKEVFGLM